METTEIRISRRKLKALVYDAAKSAKAINLIYINDTERGIYRLKDGDEFVYYKNKRKLTNKDDLARIKSLVIPPAWEKVWICASDRGHLQATGFDLKGRKQYKYHPLWNSLRNHTKFSHLYEFGKILPLIRQRIEKDISLPGMPVEKVLATVISLMQCTCIRIGNTMYEKLYGSFGLTTMKDRHVKISGSEIKFSFKGKKGVYHNISLKSKKLAQIVKQCRDIPGKELFQYYDESGQRRAIDSGMVNSYIKEISGDNFTAKDFRTWAGTLHAVEAFKEMPPVATVNETKKKIAEVLDQVAEQLGNTRTVCKKYYVHPVVLDLYANHSLDKYLSRPVKQSCTANPDLNGEEKILMKILETNTSAVVV